LREIKNNATGEEVTLPVLIQTCLWPEQKKKKRTPINILYTCDIVISKQKSEDKMTSINVIKFLVDTNEDKMSLGRKGYR